MSDIEVGPLERPAVRQNLSIQIARKCRRSRPVRRVHKLIERGYLTIGFLTMSDSVGPRQRDPADIELRLTPAFRLAPMDFHLV